MIKINLLPEEYKKEYNLEGLRRLSVFVFLSLYFIVAVFIVLLFATHIFLETESKSWLGQIESEKSTEKVKQVLGLEDDIEIVNNQINIIRTAQARPFDASNVLSSIASVVERNVYLSSLSLNSEKKQISISGYALTREAVLDLEKSLKENEWVDGATLVSPRSNILKKEDINFDFTFDIKN